MLALLIWLDKKRSFLKYVAATILVAAILAYFIGRAQPVATTVAQLEPGTAYLWKVIAEDSNGTRVESETRRFTVK